MANVLKPASTFVAARVPLVDENRMATWNFIKILQDWDTKLRNGLSSTGQIIGNIDPGTRVLPRIEGIGITLQNIDTSGVMQPAGMAPATASSQGSVYMPPGALNNHLGTAAIQPATAFDPAGAAASAQANAETYADGAAGTAQSNAEAHADAVAVTAQSNAEAFASNASNITSGTLATTRLGGLSATIVTAKLTTGGTQGSQTFVNGLLTAQVQAT